jgi:4-amino-4-deoxy-L-arabinose transferase-like glycosyltransferase
LRQSRSPNAPGSDEAVTAYVYAFALALIFGLGLSLRLLLWVNQGMAGMVFPGDQDEYYRGAIHLALRGDYYDEGQWMRPPLTSLFFAAAFALFGVNIPFALLLYSALGATLPLLLAALARRLFSSRRAGVVAALWGALFLPFASYGSQLLSENMFILCTALALLTLEIARQKAQGEGRKAAWWFGLGGATWGLTALARPVGLYALPLLALWVLWEQWRAGQRRSAFALLLSPLALLVGFALVVGPWTARNYLVYHQLVVVDTNGGVSFWLGNLLTPEERNLQQVWNETLPNSALRQQAALERARANILAEPGLFLTRMRLKAVSLWQLDLRLFAAGDTRGPTWEDSAVTFAALSDAQYVLLTLAALLGMWLAPAVAQSPPVLLWPLYGTLLSAATLGHPRLRVPLLVSLAVFAALPLARPRQTWRALRDASTWRKAGLAASVALFVFLIYAGALVPFFAGQAWLLLRPALGERAIQSAIRADPDGHLPYQALGDALLARGDAAGALDAYTIASAHAPNNAVLQTRRIDLLRDNGDAQGAALANAQIARVGWDNPQLYAWAYDALPARSTGPLDVADPLTGIADGLYAAESDGGRPFRWTLGRARMRFASRPAVRLALTLRAPRPGTLVEVRYQGLLVATLQVGTEWQRFDLPLREPAGARDLATSGGDAQIGVVELRAPTVVQSVSDPYPRGVALAAAELEYDPNPR